MDEAGHFIQCEVFQTLPKGTKSQNWGNIETFKFVKSQSTLEIFLAPDHTRGVNYPSVTQVVNLNKCRLLGSRYLS